MKNGKVLITGATGFIGSNVAELFCENGISVGCLVRKNSNLKNIEKLPVKIISGDVTRKETLTAALDGFNRVIHTAGLVNNWGDNSEFEKVNIEGTLNLLYACLENNIKDIIITSSTSTYGEENNQIVKSELSPPNSHYYYFGDKYFPSKSNYYRDTKSVAKQKAVNFAKMHGLNLTVIEPVWVYGEKGGIPFYIYLQAAKHAPFFLPGSKRNKFHVIYVRDLARAYLLAYQKKLPGVNCFIIGNNQTEYMEKVFSLFCREAGINKPKNIPKMFVYPIAFLMELICIFLNKNNPPLLTRDSVNMMYDNNEYSAANAEKVLNFVNEYSLEEGIKRTVKWFKKEKII